MEGIMYDSIINHLELVERCFFGLENFISLSQTPGIDAASLEKLCGEINLNEKNADFSLQSMSCELSGSKSDESLNEFFDLCDSVANRCQDFVREACSVNLKEFSLLSCGLFKITSAVHSLFSLLKDMARHLKNGNKTEALKLNDKIKTLETELDSYEKESFRLVMSLEISQSEKMQYMMLINKISKIPDVIKIASEYIK